MLFWYWFLFAQPCVCAYLRVQVFGPCFEVVADLVEGDELEEADQNACLHNIEGFQFGEVFFGEQSEHTAEEQEV